MASFASKPGTSLAKSAAGAAGSGGNAGLLDATDGAVVLAAVMGVTDADADAFDAAGSQLVNPKNAVSPTLSGTLHARRLVGEMRVASCEDSCGS